jgi:outer membrane receptor protein involved in Fe transport
VHDPCAAYNDPVGNGYTDLCVAQGIPRDQVGTWLPDPLLLRTSSSSGNRDLDPEKADTWTVGLVWQPVWIDGLSLALDWYSIDIEDALQWMASGAAIDTCFEVGRADSEYCEAFGRAADGNIEWEHSTYRNLSKLTAEGIDLQVEFATEAPGDMPGQFRLSLLANWNLETHGQATGQSTEYECEGLFGSPCTIASLGGYPEYRTMTTLGYDLGDFTAQLQWHWIDEMENAFNDYPRWWTELTGWPLAADTVDSTSYYDLNASWQVTESLRITGGVINLTDEEPPLWGVQSGWFNTDTSMYDPLGRRYHLSMTWRF